MRKAAAISKKVQYYGAAVGVFHSLMPKGRLRVGNSLWKSHVRVENYSPLGVVSHPNQQILGHCLTQDLLSLILHINYVKCFYFRLALFVLDKNMAQESVEGNVRRKCQFVVPKKNRPCRMFALVGEKWCGEHIVLDTEMSSRKVSFL